LLPLIPEKAITMYVFNLHRICRHLDPNPNLSNGRYVTLSPQGLRSAIRLFREMGFSIVSLRDVLANGGPAAEHHRYVALTFDDGDETVYTDAAPILEAEQCPATFFVLGGKLGGTNDWDYPDQKDLNRPRLMTLTQMQGLAQSRWFTFGSHGMTHCRLPERSLQTVHAEVGQSFQILSDNLGSAFIPVLAYPWGATCRRVIQYAKTVGYHYAFTTSPAPWIQETHPYEVPRYTMVWTDQHHLRLKLKLLYPFFSPHLSCSA
jgi:peptidoglycan/xylan/chitin deacetylase (PgdA/CDA1 family)